jgi:hypothetical protein
VYREYANLNSTSLRYIGHRGLQATVTGETLQPTDFNFQLPIILPPLLDSLSASKVPLTQLVHEGEGSIDIRQSALDKNLTEQDVLTLALQTLQHVFRALRGPSVRQALVPFFEYVILMPQIFRSLSKFANP